MQPTNSTLAKFENTWRNRLTFPEQDLQTILEKYTLLNLQQLKQMWNISGRVYHNFEHCQFLLGLAARYKNEIIASGCSFDQLVLAIAFHDIVYVPGSRHNEKASAEFFVAALKPTVDWDFDKAVYNAILATEYSTCRPAEMQEEPLAYWMQNLDLYLLSNGSRIDHQTNFVKVWFEYEKLCKGNAAEFEEKQNYFLTQLAKKFEFDYVPITWEEIYELEREYGTE